MLMLTALTAQGMLDAQLRHLGEVLGNKRIWALNVGENFQITNQAWERFTLALEDTAVAYLYVSEQHLRNTDLKVRMRDAVRLHRRCDLPPTRTFPRHQDTTVAQPHSPVCIMQGRPGQGSGGGGQGGKHVVEPQDLQETEADIDRVRPYDGGHEATMRSALGAADAIRRPCKGGKFLGPS